MRALIRRCAEPREVVRHLPRRRQPSDRDEAAAHYFYGRLQRGEKRGARHSPHDESKLDPPPRGATRARVGTPLISPPERTPCLRSRVRRSAPRFLISRVGGLVSYRRWRET